MYYRYLILTDRINIKGCHFKSNDASSYDGMYRNGLYVGGGIYVIQSGSTLYIENCSFDENQADAGGAITSFTAHTYIRNCNFTSNMAHGEHEAGGAVVIAYPALSLVLSNCIFHGNFANGSAGALLIDNVQNSTRIENSSILHSKANMFGGAITYEYSQNSSFNLIDGCEINGNQALGRGGAIYSSGMLRIVNSNFKQNSIGEVFQDVEGATIYQRLPTYYDSTTAAIDFLNISLQLRNTTVFSSNLNTSNIVYSEKVQAHLDDTSIRVTGVGNRQFSTAVIVVARAKVRIAAQFSVSCPKGYRLQEHTVNLNVKTEVGNLVVNCVQCERGYYKIDGDKCTFNTTLNEIIVEEVKCKNCPAGAVCDGVTIKSNPGFWGFLSSDGNMRFLYCPPGYCSNNATAHRSCNKRRTGIMCSNCIRGHSLSMVSTKCVENSKCWDSSLFFVLFITLAALCMLTILFLKDIVYFLKRFLIRLVRKITRTIKNLNNLHNDGTENSDDRFFIGCTQMVISFYQLQRLLQAPVTTSPPVLRQFLSTVFNLNFVEELQVIFESQFLDQ